MKTFLFTLLCTLLLCINASAQDNQVTRLPEKPNRPAYTDHTQSKSGYWFSPEILAGTTADPGSDNIQYIGADFVNGYRLNEFLRVGVGIGLKYYFNSDKLRTSTIDFGFPFYVDLRGNFISQNDREVVPFWSIDAGTEIRSGYFVSPCIGLKIGEQRSSLTIGISYMMLQCDTWEKNDDMLNLVTLKIGYEF